jgi:hypothetical protein
MKSFSIPEDFPDRLLNSLAECRRLFGPVIGQDGVCRLTLAEEWKELYPAAFPLPFLISPRCFFHPRRFSRAALPGRVGLRLLGLR